MYQWFLLDDEPLPGDENMARDEFLLERAETAGGEPVLRLYSFSPPGVTIGYNQDPVKILDLEAMGRDRVDLVRRVTGGRALLHDGELTYSVTASANSGTFGSGLHDTFLSISRTLAAALRSLGVDALISDGKRRPREGGLASPCLVSVSRYEITAGGKKIVGSAQRRTKSAFLQHGSILLRSASGGIVKYLKGDWDDMYRRITSVSEEIGEEVDGSDVRSAVIAAFAEAFSVGWKPLELSQADLEEIGRRRSAKRGEICSAPHAEVARR